MALVTQALLAALARGLNPLLALDPVALPRLAGLTGRVIAVQTRQPALRLYILPAGDGLHFAAHHEGDIDCTLSASATRLAELALARDKQRVLHQPDVRLEGDSTLLIELSDILQKLELDWQHEVSRWLGPLPAALLGDLARRGQALGEQSRDSLQLTLSNWLNEESRQLVGRLEGEARFAEIDALRLDVDRLDARLARLGTARNARDNPDE